ncbi:hypothetical protein, partial [Butyricicoccus sp.]
PPLVRTADEVAPPRREQWDKSQVHALTFMGNFMRSAAADLSLPVSALPKGVRECEKARLWRAFSVLWGLRCFFFGFARKRGFEREQQRERTKPLPFCAIIVCCALDGYIKNMV